MTTVQVRKMDEMRQVLREAAVEDEICTCMADVLKMTSVEDLVRFVSEAAYETELLTHILGKVASFKSDLLQLSRLRTAWRVARATLNKTEQRRIAGHGAEDMDEPLDASTQDTLLKQWAATYSQNLAAWLHPADSLLGRIYREFQRNTPTVISIKKVKSLLIASRPSSERKVNSGGNVKLHLSDGVADGLSITSCVGYYWRLRILGYAHSIVGQYKASSMQTQGAQVVYASLSVNMDYADLCLKRSQVWQGVEPLSWLRTKDEATRGRQVELMRMGWPQGEALQKALTKMELQWTVGPVASQTKRAVNESAGGGREEEGESPAKKVRTATTFQSAELCKKWNDQRGCPGEKECGKTHRCDIIKADGNTCGLALRRSAHRDSAILLVDLALVGWSQWATVPGVWDVGQQKVVLVTKAMADAKSSKAGGLQPEPRVVMLPAGISNLITNISALKPTQWCGKHPLPQIPWTLGIGVPILVVSLCDGVGGLPIGLLAMGATIYTDAVTMTGPLLRGFLRVFPDGCPILVGGTCPWSGRVDMRPTVFSEVPRIACEMEAEIVALKKNNQVVKFEKAREYFQGKKPTPEKFQAEGYFGLAFKPEDVMRASGKGAMATLASLMMLPLDAVTAVSMDSGEEAKGSQLPEPTWAHFGPEFDLRQSVRGTVWQPGLVETWPKLIEPTTLVASMHELFLSQGLQLDHAVQSHNVPAKAVALLQSYWVDTQMRALPGENQGIDWSMQRNKHATAMGLGSQRGGPHYAGALPALIERGVGKDAHMAFAMPLPSPFDSENAMDDDALYAARAMPRLGPYIRIWRPRMLRALEALAKAFQPWDDLLVSLMRPDVQAVARTKKPAMMACLVVLLRWPEVTVESGKQVLLGAHAVKVREGLPEKLRRGRFLPEIKESVLKEVAEGGAKEVYAENDLNSMFGVGGWLPLERFMHQQSCGKMRPIDTGKKYGRNKASLETETIYTSSPDFIAASARAFLTEVLVVMELQGHAPKGVLACEGLTALCSFLPQWSGLEIGTDDMKDAYRQCPNETPALATAAARRMTGTMAVSFFDDAGIVDSKAGVGSAQASVGAVYTCIGADLAPAKRQPMAAQRVFLGLLADVGRAHTSGFMYFDVKPFTRQELATDIDNIIAEGQCCSGQASKLRGRFGWAATAAYGKCGRGGQASLVQRQYFDTEDDLTPALTATLTYMKFLALNVPPRTIRLLGPALAAIKIYSDASFEPPMKAKLGYVIFMNDGSRPIVQANHSHFAWLEFAPGEGAGTLCSRCQVSAEIGASEKKRTRISTVRRSRDRFRPSNRLGTERGLFALRRHETFEGLPTD
ncbi:unnamed protein product [Polarella glacialis]|uniref:Dinoflagellate luciferase N-terminal domain-containing protein n=1 Tax=Polarella glacialis TaxID=89957 RepID=A0A813L8X7_POLGL|nr:unnamed protein product [Polarella glacialis]